MSPDLRSGSVIYYPYLWRWQRDRGETEGRKSRPVCVAISVQNKNDNTTHLALLAISSQPPLDESTAIEVPQIECRRAGLSDLKSAWVTISEYNYDIAEHSYYFEPGQAILGRFSKSFMMRLGEAFIPLVKSGEARVDRTRQ